MNPMIAKINNNNTMPPITNGINNDDDDDDNCCCEFVTVVCVEVEVVDDVERVDADEDKADFAVVVA
jgi:hypothetical protein